MLQTESHNCQCCKQPIEIHLASTDWTACGLVVNVLDCGPKAGLLNLHQVAKFGLTMK